jgi:broad specificity phosphatase PhoE
VELLLIRHARAQPGLTDPPLDAVGRAQAARLAEWLVGEHLDALWTSPARRARETAAAVAAVTGLGVAVDAGLAELDAGGPYAPVATRRAAIAAGEYVDDDTFVPRVLGAFGRIVAGNPGRRIAVVAHGGVLNVYLADVLGLAAAVFFEPLPAGISRVVAARTGQRSVVSLNETGHLRGIER